MRTVHALYGAGVACAAAVGFCSPEWFSGFAPLAVGLVWAAYDLTEAGEARRANPAAAKTRRG